MASLTRPVLNRQLQLRIHPRPQNLGESRAIYNLMSQFGEIEYYRSLKYDAAPVPNTVLCIYREEEGAARAVKGSPVRFLMERGRVGGSMEAVDQGVGDVETVEAMGIVEEEQQQGEEEDGLVEEEQAPTGAWGLGSRIQEQTTSWGEHRGAARSPYRQQNRALSTNTLPTPPPKRAPFPMIEPSYSPPPGLQHQQDEQRAGDKPRMFQIFANQSRAKLKDHIAFGPYYGSFGVTTSAVQEMLYRKLPGHARRGLSVVDWRRGEKPWRVATAERERIAREFERGGLMGVWEEVGGEGFGGERRG